MYPNDIRPLTSLRIVAALWVLAYHFRDHLGLDADRLGLVAKGHLGVDLFFILSGFILSHVYLSRWEARTFNYGSFLWARLARIYPVHLVTLAATIAIWLVAAVLVALGFFALIFWAVESHGLPLPEVTRLGSSPPSCWARRSTSSAGRSPAA